MAHIDNSLGLGQFKLLILPPGTQHLMAPRKTWLSTRCSCSDQSYRVTMVYNHTLRPPRKNKAHTRVTQVAASAQPSCIIPSHCLFSGLRALSLKTLSEDNPLSCRFPEFFENRSCLGEWNFVFHSLAHLETQASPLSALTSFHT